MTSSQAQPMNENSISAADWQELADAVLTGHRLTMEQGLAVLREGGNAIEAMLAMAATIAVVYPQANSLGGDGFWLIAPPNGAPIGIEGAGIRDEGLHDRWDGLF